MVQQLASDNTQLITQVLAESLRDLINAPSDPRVEQQAHSALERYDKIFSTKPNVNCRCKHVQEQKESNGKDTDRGNN